MNNVTFVPNYGQSPLLDTMREQTGQMAALAAQKQQQAAEADRQRKLAYLQSLLALKDPGQQATAYAGAPADVQGMMPDPRSLPAVPTPEPTAEDQAKTAAFQSVLATIKAGQPGGAAPDPEEGQSMTPPPGSAMAGNAPRMLPVSGASTASPLTAPSPDAPDSVPASPQPTLGQKLLSWVTAQKLAGHAPSPEEFRAQVTALTSGDQGLADSSAIADKRALNAEEITKVPLTQAQTAEANAGVPLKGAQAAQARAAAAKDYAEASKAGEETKGLKATNAIMGGVAGGASPAGPTVPLAQAPAIVRMLVNREYDPTLMRKWKPEQQEALLQAASQYDPKLNLQDYPEQFAIKKDFASGKSKNNVQSLNTAIGHTYDMWSASKSINNFDNLPLVNTLVNKGLNAAKIASGGDLPVIKYNTAATGATQELASLFKGGVGTEGEVHDWKENAADPNKSADQRAAAIQQLAHMIGSRTEALAQNYNRTGRDFYQDQLSAKSKLLLQRMGIDPKTFDITSSGTPGPTTPAIGPSPAANAVLQSYGVTP